jgi:hypothetical protein
MKLYKPNSQLHNAFRWHKVDFWRVNLVYKGEIQNMSNTERETWNTERLRLKDKYPSLSDRDLDFEEGEKEDMLERVAKIVGSTKSALKAWLVPK